MVTGKDMVNSVRMRRLHYDGSKPKFRFLWKEPGPDFGKPVVRGIERERRVRYRSETKSFVSAKDAEWWLGALKSKVIKLVAGFACLILTTGHAADLEILPKLLQELAVISDAGDRLEALEQQAEATQSRLDNLALSVRNAPQPKPDLTLREQVELDGFLNIRDPRLPGSTDNDRYVNAVQFILDEWGYHAYDNPHIGGAGPLFIEGFRGVSQAQLPWIFYPFGHYDFTRTLWLHPGIAVKGEGWGTRWWFKEGTYTDDRNWWREGSKSGNEFGLKVAIAVANDIKHPNGQVWMGYGQRMEDLNIKFMIEGGCTGIAILGHQHNPHLINLHLVNDKNRTGSVAINCFPSSFARETPWGENLPSYYDPSNPSAGLSSHLLDARLTGLMLEYWQRGVVFNGIGCRLEGISYYTQCGFHYYGRSGWGVDTLTVDWQSDHYGMNKGPWTTENSVAGIVRAQPGKLDAIKVASALPLWVGLSVAPATRGGFTFGQGLW